MRTPGPTNPNRQLLMTAVELHQKGQLDQAEPIYRKILESEPRNPDALHLLGLLEHQRGRNEVARSMIEKALMLRPGEPTFLVNLSQVHRVTGRLSEAEQCLRRAISAQPRLAEAHSNLASVLRMQKRLDEAEAAARQALSLNPNFGNAMMNLGTVFEDRGRYPEALECFKRALQNGASRADVLNNVGDALCCMGRWEEGRQALEEAVKAAPQIALSHWNLSLVYLLHGELLRGFTENEWRLKHASSDIGRFKQPMWRGEELGGRSIVLHMEQGFGDAIQFARYVPMVAERGGKVIVEVREELVRLMRTVKGVEQVIARGKPIPPHDFHAPLMSLPHLFKTTLSTIPSSIPYVSAEPSVVEQWALRMPVQAGVRRIGLVWSGNPDHRNDRNRSLPAAALAPLAKVANAQWFTLQFGPAAAQAKSAGVELVDLTASMKDFADTAAMLMNLDLVITVDTAIAHLAGALGRPVWVLLPTIPDWRWLLDREDNPWYRTARLFRQSKQGDWMDVIDRVYRELAHG